MVLQPRMWPFSLQSLPLAGGVCREECARCVFSRSPSLYGVVPAHPSRFAFTMLLSTGVFAAEYLDRIAASNVPLCPVTRTQVNFITLSGRVTESKLARLLLLLAVAITMTGTKRAYLRSSRQGCLCEPDHHRFPAPGLNSDRLRRLSRAMAPSLRFTRWPIRPAFRSISAVSLRRVLSASATWSASFRTTSRSTPHTSPRKPRAAAGTFTRAAADSGGTLTQLDSGKYQYVFKAKAPAGFDATATHTIGLYGSRNMAAFGIPNNFASAIFNFVPNGAKVTHVRDVVRTASCNGCHDQLSAHGGRRRRWSSASSATSRSRRKPPTGIRSISRFSFTSCTWARSCPA